MLSSLYDAINAELGAINAFARLEWDEDQIATHAPPPRMIVIPSDDQFDSPKTSAGNPRALYTVWEGAQLIIQGATRDHCQGMRDQFTIALHKALKKGGAGTVYAGMLRLSGGQWTRAQYLATNGFEYRLRFATLVAIVDRVWADVDPPQPPDASTYVGVLTYPIVPGKNSTGHYGVTGQFDVGVSDSAENPKVIVSEGDE